MGRLPEAKPAESEIPIKSSSAAAVPASVAEAVANFWRLRILATVCNFVPQVLLKTRRRVRLVFWRPRARLNLNGTPRSVRAPGRAHRCRRFVTKVMFSPRTLGDLSKLTSGKYAVRLSPCVIAAAVEGARVQAPEVANTRDRHADEPVHKLVHPHAPQRHLSSRSACLHAA